MTVQRKILYVMYCTLYFSEILSQGHTQFQQLPDTSRNHSGRRGNTRITPVKQNTTQQVENNPRNNNGEENDFLAQAITLLQRLNDRFTALQALDEQQLRRLETLEYRLTKLEVQQQEKIEGLRTELREVTRRVQQLDWQSSKMDTTLESIKVDTTGLNQGQEHLRGMLSLTDNRFPSTTNSELKGKLQAAITALLGMKGSLITTMDRLAMINTNITKLNNMTKQLLNLSNKTVTKQHLNTMILEIKENSMWPTSLLTTSHTSDIDDNLPWDCYDIQQKGYNTSGVYKIKPPQARKSFYIYCDMETLGGGWTVIQNRYEGTTDFYRGWEDYKNGFGNLGGEFWLGLQKIYLLTNHKINELHIELEDFSHVKTFARYMAFAIGEEKEGYPINILGGYDGDAGDSLIYHAGMKFSTYDMDNDMWNDGNCAESHTGAWWYNGCDTSNLNGRYLGGELVEDYEYQGIYWYDWHGPMYSLMKSRIALRPSKGLHMSLNTTDTKTKHTAIRSNTSSEEITTMNTTTKKIRSGIPENDYVIEPYYTDN